MSLKRIILNLQIREFNRIQKYIPQTEIIKEAEIYISKIKKILNEK